MRLSVDVNHIITKFPSSYEEYEVQHTSSISHEARNF